MKQIGKKKRSILLIIVFILESRGRKLLNRQNEVNREAEIKIWIFPVVLEVIDLSICS